MVVNIVPVGNGHAEEKGTRHAIVFYILGSLAGGILLGAFLSAAGALLRSLWPAYATGKDLFIFLGIGFLLASFREVGIWNFRLPESGGQVPRHWFFTYRPHLGSFAWGGFLSLGFLTPVVCISFYAVAITIALVAGHEIGLLLAVAYVIGRVMPVIGIRYLVSRSGREAFWYVRQSAPLASVVLVVNGILLMGLGSFLLTAAAFYH